MAITSSAKKAIKVSARKRVFNLRRVRAMKSAIKEARATATGVTGKSGDVQAKLSAAYQAIDKAAKRGVIKKNTASRKKSRIAKVIAKTTTK